jgi:glycosyltransferase involved in cell wall biosynthesis
MLSEEIVHAQTGYTANRENAFSLARWTIRAMQNPQFQLGKLGREFILDNFTWDKCIESYKRIIKEVVWSKRKRVFN